MLPASQCSVPGSQLDTLRQPIRDWPKSNPRTKNQEPRTENGVSMSILKVARLGHPVLRHHASDVEVADIRAGKFRALIDDMIETMHAYEGVGLAGPQVHLPLRIFAFEFERRIAKPRGINHVRAGVYYNSTY